MIVAVHTTYSCHSYKNVQHLFGCKYREAVYMFDLILSNNIYIILPVFLAKLFRIILGLLRYRIKEYRH